MTFIKTISWIAEKSGQSLNLTFALKVRFVRCTYRTTASRCSLNPLKISFVGIFFCFLTLVFFSFGTHIRWALVEIRCPCAGEYVDYHLAAEPAPAPSTTAPPPQLSSPHHPGGHHVHQWLEEWMDILFVPHNWSFFGFDCLNMISRQHNSAPWPDCQPKV